MKEVSCKVLQVVFRELQGKDADPAMLAKGTPYDLEHLRAKHERIEWTAYLQVMKNASRVWTAPELIELGRAYIRSPWIRYGRVIARLMFSTKDFYKWVASPRGAGLQVFTCVEPSLRHLGQDRLEITLAMKDGYEPCREFYLVSQGTFTEMPCILGYPPADVTMRRTDRAAIYDINLPKAGGVIAAVRRTILWPFTIVAAGRELKDAHEVLLQRYHELEEARATLKQKVEARTAELKVSNERLAETVECLERARGTRERIFANISHEIRTPLTMTTMAVNRIRRHGGTELDEEAQRGLASIDENVSRLLNLINGLLLLAKADEEGLTLTKRSHNVALKLRQLVSTWSMSANEAGVSLTYGGPERLAADCDLDAIDSVVTNLVSNAIKFTPDGGSIAVELEAAGDEILIAVRDTGVGIDEGFLPRVFDRFEQGRVAVRGGSPGSGIGLSIVKELVEAHGGSVMVSSNRGGGSLFRVSIPVAAAANGEQPAPSRDYFDIPFAASSPPIISNVPEVAEVTAPPGSAVEATILVAEDEPGLRAALVECLARRYRVLAAGDGLRAIELATTHLPDLLLTDLSMPGMDGIELTRRFRNVKGNRLAPVILLTAYGGLDDRLSGLEAGAVDYLLKPIDPKELLARVASQLRLRDLALRLNETEKLASLAVLSSGLAHEIRNPANVLLNAIEPLRRRLPRDLATGPGPVSQLLDALDLSANQIASLSRELLGLARSDEMRCSPQRVADLVERACAIASPKLAGIEVERTLDFDGSLSCAGGLVLQILAGLLENAAAATGEGGLVSVRTTRSGNDAVFEVCDDGPGVPPEFRQRIFEPFFTTKEPGVGTGLGLTTALRIAEAHHGSLTLVDGRERTIFRLALPIHGPPSVPLRTGSGKTDTPHARSA